MDTMDEARRLRQRALAALEIRRPERAAADATRAIALEPGVAQGHLILGWALVMLDKPLEALEAADVGLSHAADDARLPRLRSVALFELKRFEEALRSADDAAALAPHLAEVHSARAFALSALGRGAEAIEAASTAVSLEPEEANHHTKLGEEHIEVDPLLAERHARAALALMPEDVAALTLLGGALVRQKRDDEAYDVWQEAIRLDPTAETPKAALVHHVNRDLSLGAFQPFLLRAARRAQALIPPPPGTGLGRKIGVAVGLLGAVGALKGLTGLAEVGAPMREARLKRRAPQLHALYLRLKEDLEEEARKKQDG